VESRDVLDAVVKKKIPSPRRESNPRSPTVQPVKQTYVYMDLSVTGKIILEWILEKQVCKVWTGFI
jgi:hypothetical protein